MFDNTIFEKIDNEEKAYWLGFLYADGCIHQGNGDYRIELGLKEEDYHHLEKFRDFVGKQNKISHRDNTKSYRYNFRDKKVHQDLINLGCVPAKSLILQFPTKEQVPDIYLKDFMRGYFDGDGSFWFEGEKIGMNILSSKDFLFQMKNRIPLLEELNIYPIHYDRPDKGQRIQTGNKQLVKSFLDWIYADSSIYLDRKYQKYIKYLATL